MSCSSAQPSRRKASAVRRVAKPARHRISPTLGLSGSLRRLPLVCGSASTTSKFRWANAKQVHKPLYQSGWSLSRRAWATCPPWNSPTSFRLRCKPKNITSTPTCLTLRLRTKLPRLAKNPHRFLRRLLPSLRRLRQPNSGSAATLFPEWIPAAGFELATNAILHRHHALRSRDFADACEFHTFVSPRQALDVFRCHSEKQFVIVSAIQRKPPRLGAIPTWSGRKGIDIHSCSDSARRA